MADEQTPFLDVRREQGGFSIPALKWRELLFTGALRPDGEGFVRDPSRPRPPFAVQDLFPPGVRLTVEQRGRRVVVRREGPGGGAGA